MAAQKSVGSAESKEEKNVLDARAPSSVITGRIDFGPRIIQRLIVTGTALLSIVSSPRLAGAYEIINLYDAFGEERAGTRKDFGFSAVIRHEGTTILFDAGTSADILEQNANALGVDLREVDFAVASHAHADHTGGFDYLLRVNPRIKIYFPNDFFGAGAPLTFDISGAEPEVVRELPEEQCYFGGKTMSAVLESDGRFYKAVEYVTESQEVAPGFHLIATTSPNIGYFTKYPGVDLEGRPITDGREENFLGLPELSLAVSTGESIVLIVGCSHSTVEEIVRETKEITGSSVGLLVGGYHLLPYDRGTIQGIGSRLKALGVERIAPSHCTGHLGFKVLRDIYGGGYELFGLGSTLRD
jgi:7,8-dihydropterin-6-yl-methyl-4-(beta-D-ribofuranosyl)aminobenzene 5'-phosphate synthase